MVRIYLVRHAEAMGNVQEFFQGNTDTEISHKGELQLEMLAQRFKDIPVDAVYSSPLKRAVATANAVSQCHHKINIIPEIIEINGGDWEGMSWADIPKRYPSEYSIWNNEINKFVAPNGESTKQVHDRMIIAMRKIASENEGKTIAVISHGMAIKSYLVHASGIEWDNFEDMGWSDNTAVSLIEYDDKLVPHILFKNNSEHLSDELSTLAVSKWCKKTEETVCG